MSASDAKSPRCTCTAAAKPGSSCRVSTRTRSPAATCRSTSLLPTAPVPPVIATIIASVVFERAREVRAPEHGAHAGTDRLGLPETVLKTGAVAPHRRTEELPCAFRGEPAKTRRARKLGMERCEIERRER